MNVSIWSFTYPEHDSVEDDMNSHAHRTAHHYQDLVTERWSRSLSGARLMHQRQQQTARTFLHRRCKRHGRGVRGNHRLAQSPIGLLQQQSSSWRFFSEDDDDEKKYEEEEEASRWRKSFVPLPRSVLLRWIRGFLRYRFFNRCIRVSRRSHRILPKNQIQERGVIFRRRL